MELKNNNIIIKEVNEKKNIIVKEFMIISKIIKFIKKLIAIVTAR